MNLRAVPAALAVCVLGALTLSASASARMTHHRVVKAAEENAAGCVLHSLPSFIDQGEGRNASSVADIVEIECAPVYAEHLVRLSATELYDRCGRELIWFAPFPFFGDVPTTPGFTVSLDNDGNATVVLWGGPSCAAGESLISAHLLEAPYTTTTTAFTVLPPAPTTPGATALPGSEVANELTGSAATIVEVEFPPVYAGAEVDISAEQLYARCLIAPHLLWLGPGGFGPEEGSGTFEHLKLDDDGNAFAILLAGGSCAAGASQIEASLEQAPYTTFTTSFTVEAPRPTN